MKRREALRWAGGVLAAMWGARLAEAADAPPKAPKIAAPPEDEDKAEEDLRASEMIGLSLRVIRPGQMVTQEYNDGRLTVTVDKNNIITDIRIG
jgi:Peptidase inhibitor I78 family